MWTQLAFGLKPIAALALIPHGLAMTQTRQGYLLMIAAAMLIPLGDAVAKFAHQTFDVPISFMAWSRFALGAVLLAPFALAQGIRLSELTPLPVLLRGLTITATVFLILQGVALAPIADVFGAFFIAPLISFGLAVLVLKERPGVARTGLILLGFVGVLLIVQPGANMSTGLIFALVAGLFYGVFLAANRAMSGSHRAVAMLWAQLIVGGIVMAPLGATLDLPANWLFAVCVLISASTSVFANYLMVLAYRRVQASRLAPLVYVQLIGATLYGVLFFAAIPGPLALSGLVLLFGSGIAALGLAGTQKS